MATTVEAKVDQDKEGKDEISNVANDELDDKLQNGESNTSRQEIPKAADNGKQTEGKDAIEETDSNSKSDAVLDEGDTDKKSRPSDEVINDEAEDFDLSNTEILNDGDRNRMFEEAVKLDKEGNKNKALKCYLKCLVGLTERTQFPLLPQCLRNISDIYHAKDEYEKAISFMQAEKMYYESVLINETDLQKQLEEISKDSNAESGDANLDLLRASEYEQLAKLCMEEKQPHLALEYAGKATKLRQNVYSDDHPVVQESLNYFTALYAEAGKAMYAENLKKYEEVGPPDLSSLDDDQDEPSTSEPSSILRKRKSTESEREKRVRFDESQFIAPHEVTEREEKMARTVLMLLFITLLCVVIVLGLYIYCYINPSLGCSSIKIAIRDGVMRVKYWYYYYISGISNKMQVIQESSYWSSLDDGSLIQLLVVFLTMVPLSLTMFAYKKIEYV